MGKYSVQRTLTSWSLLEVNWTVFETETDHRNTVWCTVEQFPLTSSNREVIIKLYYKNYSKTTPAIENTIHDHINTDSVNLIVENLIH